LILGSSSRYRAELLSRLGLPFETSTPQVDETPHAGEAPAATAFRLARDKAIEVAHRHPGAVVIGSDQVADLAGHAIGKPGSHDRAVQQLQRMSGQTVVFHTAVCVAVSGTLNLRAANAAPAPASRDRPASAEDLLFEQTRLVPVTVKFRLLSAEEISHYLLREQPYDCAGSAKCESLGIALLEAITSEDPTALIGLPLIATCRLLRAAGLDPLRPDAV
jgi:septum formation protein